MISKILKAFISIFLVGLINSCDEISINQSCVGLDIFETLKEGDTISVSANFANRSELGGHEEVIFIVKRESESGLSINYRKDTVIYDSSAMIFRRPIFNTSRKFTQADKQKLSNYIELFDNEKQKDKQTISNQSNTYQILLLDSSWRFSDDSMKWDGFDKLKRELFYQANR